MSSDMDQDHHGTNGHAPHASDDPEDDMPTSSLSSSSLANGNGKGRVHGKAAASSTSSSSKVCCGSTRCYRCCWCCPLNSPHRATKLAKWGGCVLVGACLALTIAILVPLLLKNALEEGIKKAVYLTSREAKGFKNWQDNVDTPLKTSAYVYDITNLPDVMEGAKPILQEVGPFVYYKRQTRFALDWSDNDEQLYYKSYDRYIFSAAESVALDSEYVIHTVNIPFWGLATNLKGIPQGMNFLYLICEMFSNPVLPMQSRIFTNRTVKEVLFGYVDELLTVANSFSPESVPSNVFPGLIKNHTSFENAAASQAGNVIWTGLGHADEIRRFIRWDNMTEYEVCQTAPCPPNVKLPAWLSPEAGRIGGCDGSQFTPHIDEHYTPMVWDPSSGRRLSLKYDRETSYKDIDTLQFYVPETYMQNSTLNPFNANYFQNDTANGLYNVSVIAAKTPAFLSKPRMTGVGSSIKDTVEFLPFAAPLVNGGRTFQDIEPYSGIPMHAVAQSQFNVAVGPLDGLPVPGEPDNVTTTWFPQVEPATVPVFWVIQEAGIDDANAKQFRNDFYGALFVADVCQIGGFTVFGLMLFSSLAMVFYGTHRHHHMRRPHNETQRLLGEGGDSGGSSDGRQSRTDSAADVGEEGRRGSAIDISYQSDNPNRHSGMPPALDTTAVSSTAVDSSLDSPRDTT